MASAIDGQFGQSRRVPTRALTSRHFRRHWSSHASWPAAGPAMLSLIRSMAAARQVALQHGRRYLGIELNPEYGELTRVRLQEVVDTMAAADVRSRQLDVFASAC